jgi:hypothetical protein
MPPLALTDEKMDRVLAAASLLPATSRDGFLKSVAGRVAGVPCLGMAEIEEAIAFVLNNYGITGSSQAFDHPKRNNRSKIR